jgi:hypothetical protein
MVIFNFGISIAEDKENWLLFSKIVPGGVSWHLGPNEPNRTKRRKKAGPP